MERRIKTGLPSLLCLLGILVGPVWAEPTLRIGVLAYGTLNWELETIKQHQLDQKNGFQIAQRKLATPQAGKIALLSEAADVIVSDWTWVSRQRAAGRNFTFWPYSATSGALVIPRGSSIKGLADLSGKRIGIAGGELDKNWLLLTALAKRKENLDLNISVEKIFGAPPLLSHQLAQGNLDALLTYWHYAARLEATGFQELMNGQVILEKLGVEPAIPTIGYVFREDWAENNRSLVDGFLAATVEAKNLLCESDPAWQAIEPLTRTELSQVRNQLRKSYCAGRIANWGEKEKSAIAEVFKLLHETGGPRLTGRSPVLQPGTFWSRQTIPNTEIDRPPASAI
ncbi:MAG: ABC transporter substrate-binding protein [Methylococcus sp.]|nr:MAG: ABC transporter substrate-binding protein [Methylococcus sp.]